MTRLPRTAGEFLALVDQAVFEMDELAICAGEDLDDETADLEPVFRDIAAALRALYRRIEQGRHVFATGADLPFMAIARSYRHLIPIFQLLNTLNDAHRRGPE